MKKHIKLVTSAVIAVILLASSTNAEADHHGDHSKTNKVDKASVKSTPKKTNGVDWRAKGAEDRKKYTETLKKIREAVKSGKLTEKQAKEKYSELRKNMGSGLIYGERVSRSRRTDILKKFDKNKDGKLDDKEKAEARKAISKRSKRPEREDKKRSRRGDKRKDKSSRRSRK